MSFRRRHRILAAGKSPSVEAMKRTYNRAILNGGVTQDFSANVENIREISRKLGYNTLQDATFVYVPSSYGESRNFVQNPSIRNLGKFSEEFDNGVWNTVTVSANFNNFTAPDGNITADKVTGTASNSFVFQNIPVFTNTMYTYSIWLRNDTPLTTKISVSDLGGGVLVAQTTVNLTTTWTRFQVTFNSTTNSTIKIFAIGGFSSFTTGNTAYLWGAQLESGQFATPYQRTTDGIADFTFTRNTSSTVTNKQGIIEDSCYNMLKSSEQFDSTDWTKQGVNISADVILAPNGTLTADKSAEDTSGSIHTVKFPFTIINTGFQIFSFHAKKAERSFVRAADGNGTFGAIFDLTSGTSTPQGSAISATSKDVGNGWFRCSVLINNTLASNTYFIENMIDSVNTIYTGTTGFGIYLWGAQLEQGSVLRPYLKTTNRLNVAKYDYTSPIPISRRNQLSYSEEFDNAYWNKARATITANATVAPNGTMTADKFVETTATNFKLLNSFPTTIIGNTYTYSVYLKAAERSWVEFYMNNQSVGGFVNVSNGALGVNEGAVITSTNAGNGWFRFSMTIVATVTNCSPALYLAQADNVDAYTGDGVSGVYVWGAQFEAGGLTDYQTIYGVSGVSQIKSKPSWSVEPQRTNLLLQSSDLNNTGIWQQDNASSPINTTLNPFNTNKSFYILDNSVNSPHRVLQNISVTAGTTYTVSIYVKKADDTWCQFALGTDPDSTVWSNFNFDTGTFGNQGSGGGSWNVKQLINGYWLITLTRTITNTSGGNFILLQGTNNTNSTTRDLVYTGTSRNVCDVAAVQVEVGSNATSYIQTTTATVTRNGDISYVDLWNNNILNQNNFTLYVEGYLYNGSNSSDNVFLSSNPGTSATDSIGFWDAMRGFIVISGSTTILGSNSSANNYYKILIQVNGTTVKFFKNGAQMGTDQTVRTFNYRYLNITTNGSTYTVDKIALFNRTLDDASCVLLTT